jgi:D-lactate dehydrogenase (cytochrome)
MNAYVRVELTRPAPEVIAKVIAELTREFGNRCVTSKAVREQHANTLTWTENQPPDAVVYPMTTEEVVQIVKLCATHKVPIIAFGTGSSFEGHVNAPIGMSQVTSLRLLPRAPSTRSDLVFSVQRRFSGIGISRAPVR